MNEARKPGQRAGLTHAGVLAAARGLLLTYGVDALTMRALAHHLGVTPNALYSHVESKTQLLDDLLDDLLVSVEAPTPDVEDPVAGLTSLMTSTYDVLIAHPDLVPIYLARQGARGDTAVHLGEIMDILLTRAGVRATAIAEARRVLIVHTIGFAAFTTSAPDTERPVPIQEVRQNFNHSLRWLLAGITQSTAVSVPPPPQIETFDDRRDEVITHSTPAPPVS